MRLMDLHETTPMFDGCSGDWEESERCLLLGVLSLPRWPAGAMASKPSLRDNLAGSDLALVKLCEVWPGGPSRTTVPNPTCDVVVVCALWMSVMQSSPGPELVDRAELNSRQP